MRDPATRIDSKVEEALNDVRWFLRCYVPLGIPRRTKPTPRDGTAKHSITFKGRKTCRTLYERTFSTCSTKKTTANAHAALQIVIFGWR